VRKRCTIGSTSEADAAAMLAEAKNRYFQKRLDFLGRAHSLMTEAKTRRKVISLITSIALVLNTSAAVVIIPDTAQAWFPHGTGITGSSPQWPVTPGGYTPYWVADPSAGGSDSNNGTSSSTPWATIPHALTALASATGNVALNFLSTFSYLAPSTGFVAPTSPTNFIAQGLVGAVIPPVIQANGSGFSGILQTTGSNQTFQGLQTAGDGGASNLAVALAGSSNSIRYCRIALATAAADSVGYSVNYTGTAGTIDHCVLGGIAKTSSEQVGLAIQSYGLTCTNNIFQFYGAQAGDAPVLNGFAIHLITSYVTFPDTTPFTYSAGVPTNYLCNIGFNIFHDCSWNLNNNGGAGGPSGIEVGGASARTWLHDNISFNMNPGPSGGGTDYDPFDFADGNAMWILCERNFAYGSFGGLIDFASPNAAGWGPVIVRYNLGINCGFDFTYGGAGIGNFAVQGEGNNGVHQWYGNTFVLCAANAASAGSYLSGNFTSGIASAGGFFVNNIIVTIYPWAAVKFDSLPTSWANNNNCWFGAGEGFDFRPVGGGAYSTYAAAKAAQSTFDQNGVTGDPLFAQEITNLSWAGGVATVTTANPHGQTGTFTGTIDGSNWYNGASPTAMNGTFTMTVTGANSFTFPLASDPTTGGFLASTGTWAVGTVAATLVAASWKLGSTSSSCYRTGINVATTYSVDAGSTDFFGNPVSGTPNIGCDAYGSP